MEKVIGRFYVVENDLDRVVGMCENVDEDSGTMTIKCLGYDHVIKMDDYEISELVRNIPTCTEGLRMF